MFRNPLAQRFGTAASTAALLLALSVPSVARANTLSFTTTGAGSVTIPAGYEWTNVTVQCWGAGGGGGGGGIFLTGATDYGGGGGGGGGYSAKTYTVPLVAGAIATTSAAAAAPTAETAEAQFGTISALRTLLPAGAPAVATAPAWLAAAAGLS